MKERRQSGGGRRWTRLKTARGPPANSETRCLQRDLRSEKTIFEGPVRFSQSDRELRSSHVMACLPGTHLRLLSTDPRPDISRGLVYRGPFYLERSFPGLTRYHLSPAITMDPPPHPYYPPGIHLSGGLFVPNVWSVSALVLTFAAGLTLLLLLTFLIARSANPHLSYLDRVLVLWFVLSESRAGSRHLVRNPDLLP